MWFAITNFPCNSLKPEVQLLHASGQLVLPPYLDKFQVHFPTCDCAGLHFLLHCRSTKLLSMFDFVHHSRPNTFDNVDHIYDDLNQRSTGAKQQQKLPETGLIFASQTSKAQDSTGEECKQSMESSPSESDSPSTVFKQLQLNGAVESLPRDRKQTNADPASFTSLPADSIEMCSQQNRTSNRLTCPLSDSIATYGIVHQPPSNRCDLWPYSAGDLHTGHFSTSLLPSITDPYDRLKSSHLYAQVTEPLYVPIPNSSNGIYQQLDFTAQPKCPLNSISFQPNHLSYLSNHHFPSDSGRPKDTRSFCQRLLDCFCCI
jgi:hypothetical protein